MTHTIKTIDQFFNLAAISLTQKYANTTSPRGMETKEICFRQYSFEDIRYCKYNMSNADVEDMELAFEQLMLSDKDKQNLYMQRKLHDMVIGYLGIEFRKQLLTAMSVLRRDKDSRQAVINFNNSDKFDFVPCTTQIQYMIRNGRLDCIVSMRSMDLVNKGKFDIYMFMVLQQVVANTLNVDYGQLHLSVNSLHYYTKDSAAINSMICDCDFENEHKFHELRTMFTFNHATWNSWII